jgi:hypothetical protein
VSRYKFAEWLVSYPGAGVYKMSTGAVSRYNFDKCSEFVSVAKGLEMGRGGYPGLAPNTNLSWWQEQKQKP